MKPQPTDRNFETQGKVSSPILYDVTRLVTRGLNPAPNGIDRIDFALARYFLSDPGAHNKAFIYTLMGPKLVSAYKAMETLERIEAYWDNNSPEKISEELKVINDFIVSDTKTNKNRLFMKHKVSLESLSVNLHSLWNWALSRGDSLALAGEGAIYLNASQFLLDKEWFVKEVLARQNIKCVFYIHDLIASEYPEFFTQQEVVSFNKKIRNISRYGCGYITASQTVSQDFSRYLENNGFDYLPACIYRPKVPDAFLNCKKNYKFDINRSYFVMCGTIEPRKNHLLLLQLWRELSENKNAPKLILIGKRGWLYDEIIGMLERCAQIQPHVLEIEGLSTSALAQLLKGSRALLAPSFIEGFGLPIVEAIAAQVPVIASDIDVFQEVGCGALDYISAIDGNGWLEAIKDYAQENSARRNASLNRIRNISNEVAGENFSDVRVFLYQL